MILSDFCDERGVVHTAVKLTGVSTHFVPVDGAVLTPAQWAERRARILVDRKYTVVDDVLAQLFRFTFHEPLVLVPGSMFEFLVDEDVRDLVRFEFEGVVLSPTEWHFAERLRKENV